MTCNALYGSTGNERQARVPVQADAGVLDKAVGEIYDQASLKFAVHNCFQPRELRDGASKLTILFKLLRSKISRQLTASTFT